MPVGPSHGSRGRSSSSSRSSSRSSSSRSSRSYGSSRSYSGNRTTVIVAGGGGYSGGGEFKPMSPKAKKITWLVIGIIFCLIIGIVGVSKFSKNIGSVSLMKRDAKEYAQIISNAKKGKEGYYLVHIDNIKNTGSSHYGYEMEYSFSSSSYKFSATAYNYQVKNGVEYFYIEYQFTDDEGRKINGETYTAYSEAAIQSLDEMTIAYTKIYDGDGSWDSMDVNYKLKNNIDYWFVKKEATVGGFLSVIFLGLVALFIYMIVRIKQDKPIFKKSDTVTGDIAGKPPVRHHRTCKYCGSIIAKDVFKCPSCGSRQFYEPTVKEEKKEEPEIEEVEEELPTE